MKINIYLFIILPFISFTQHTLLILDTLNQSPLGHVAIYNVHDELIGLSNDQGKVTMASSFPFTLTCSRYQPQSIHQPKDTIYMSPIPKSTQEVVVGPFDLTDFYQKLINNSSTRSMNAPVKNIYGTYISSVLIIDSKNQDSIYLGNLTPLTLVKSSDKKSTYQLFPSNGIKTFWSTGKYEKKDTSKYEKWADIIPRFSTLLDMDLSDPKAFQINFKKFPLLERKPGSLICGNKSGTMSQSYQITFNHQLMESWTNETSTACDNTKAFDMCFASTKKVLKFHRDEIHYHLSNALLEGEINFRMNGEGFVIKLVKGFVEKDSIIQKVNASNVSIESYFKNIPYTFTAALETIYSFD